MHINITMTYMKNNIVTAYAYKNKHLFFFPLYYIIIFAHCIV